MKFICKKNLKYNDERQKQIALIEEDIGRINERIELVNKTVRSLGGEFILLVEIAGKGNMSLILKANAMKRKSLEKKKELADLENSL